jgi:DNA repair exonuclease SbcCD ATPase subunit
MKQESQPQRVEQYPCTLGSALETFQYLCGRGVCPAFHFSHSLDCKTGTNLSCIFDIMISIERHNENLTEVQKELWRLITDEDIRTILKAIIKKMNQAGDNSEHIRQCREEGQSRIPTDPKYDENYWIAAYVLYTNMEKFKELFDKLDKIKSETSPLKNELYELEDEQEHLQDIIQDLRDELKSLIDEYEDDTEEEEDEEIANLLYDI